MIPEFGHLALILGAVFALLGSVIPLIGLVKKDPYLIRYAWRLSYGAFGFISLSLFLLAYSFSVDDFSVAYIAAHSNSHLPLFFKIAAVWGGHEGSLLFWLFSLVSWSAAIAFVHRNHHQNYISRVLIVLAMLSAAFALFTLLASNPFERLLVAPAEGRDLNPMLQDVGLIFHPPMLYLGYVGFSGVFAFAVAALTMQDINLPWAKWSRPWTLAAWVMLTGGISLGSWWAYYELGWGGWWFWDPVENASLLPWLTGTALLHSLIASEKRKVLLNWSFLLAIFTFCLSLLGTFVVRSGVLTSVHAFAVDPTRGLVLLAILAIALLVSLTLYSIRIHQISLVKLESFMSREVLFLAGNSMFAVTTLMVLLGTFYPMVFQALNLGNISVGAPYFNALFAPLCLLSFVFMGLAPLSRWKRTSSDYLKKAAFWLGLLSWAIGGITFVLLGAQGGFVTLVALIMAAWIVLTSLKTLFIQKSKISLKKCAMVVAHIGVAMMVVGAALESIYSYETSSKMGPGSTAQLRDLNIEYIDTELVVGPNYTAEKAIIQVTNQHQQGVLIQPERRHYSVRTMNMSEPGIAWGWLGDIYITLGEKLSHDEYAVRIQYKAFVRWLWAGSLLMMLGGAMAVVSLIKNKSRLTTRQEDAVLSVNENRMLLNE